MAQTQVEGIPAQTSGVSVSYRNYVLFILTLVYAFNFIDRQIVAERLGLSL